MVLSFVCLSMFLCKWTHTHKGRGSQGRGKAVPEPPALQGTTDLLMASKQQQWLEMQDLSTDIVRQFIKPSLCSQKRVSLEGLMELSCCLEAEHYVDGYRQTSLLCS